MNNKVKLWFLKDIELIDIANILKQKMGLSDIVHNAEDTWEWCILHDASNNVMYDISRKHSNGYEIYDDPIGIWVRKDGLELAEDDLVSVAKEIAKILFVNVSMGEVRYIRGNDFEFFPHKVF
ncbi:hypothetical protein [Paenibacillus sp. RC67]|uniref:hypothetical protein n=1 Tax=Paenibacillus sp. RC67 TaxID=3039392 RepID=UPI0024AE011C|nr:hypothetical protein [Paenibacillus sp. RC67]